VHIIPNGSASGFGELQQLPASHIRAAAKYLQEVVLSDRSRRRVAAAKYVIRPESYHMQVQHKKVRSAAVSMAYSLGCPKPGLPCSACNQDKVPFAVI
jgi:hypothetical protein